MTSARKHKRTQVYRATLEIVLYDGLGQYLNAMTPAVRDAFVTRALRKFLNNPSAALKKRSVLRVASEKIE